MNSTVHSGRSIARMVLVMVAAVTAFAVAAALPAPAHAAQQLCTGFSGCAAAGYPNFDYSSVYTAKHWGQDAGHNCTNYVAYRFSNVGIGQPAWLGYGNADMWGVWASSITNGTPAIGSIAWWGSSSAYGVYGGHVSIVEKVNPDGSFIDSDDNWGGDFHWRAYTPGTSDWPTGFIHLNDTALNDGWAGGGSNPPPPPDSDGDGVPDSVDACPYVPGDELGIACPRRELSGDFDGDGHTDIAVFYDYGNLNLGLWMFPGTSTGPDAPRLEWLSGPGNWDWNNIKPVSGDFNGDGYSDIVAFYNYGGGETRAFLFRGSSTGITLSAQVFDSGAGNWDWDRCKLVAGDFNHDGYSDVLAFYNYGGADTKIWLFRGNSTGLSNPTMEWDSGAGNWDWNNIKPVSGDFNGDGRADVAAFYTYNSSTWGLWLFSGAAASVNSPIWLWGPWPPTSDWPPPLSVSPLLSISAPSGLYVGRSITFTYSLKNTTGSTINAKVISVPVRLGNTNLDAVCSGGANVTIPAGGTFNCSATRTFSTEGDYIAWADWQDAGGQWHHSQLGRDVSFHIGPVPPTPTNTALPSITGTAQVGSTLTCSNGSWSNSPTSYAEQWLRDGSAISSATASTYELVSADADHDLSCKVTASNAGGSASATSASVLVKAASGSGGSGPSGSSGSTGSTSSAKACIVPKLKGLKLAKAKKRLVAHHCRAGKVTRRHSTKVKKGRVISSSPKAGAHRKNRAKVALVVSRGK
jgi:surface antigen